MWPIIKRTKAGRELGNAAAAAEIAGIEWETYQWYVRTKRPDGNPAPKHVEIDNDTGQRMYSMEAVREWHAKRPGRGNWGGIGAQARKTPAELAADAYKRRQRARKNPQTEDTAGGGPTAYEPADASV